MKSFFKPIAAAAIGFAFLASAQAAEIVVGGKNFTEQRLLAEITTQLLAADGFTVSKQDGLASDAARQALLDGTLDLYWGYTGTSLVNFHDIHSPMDAAETYATVKALDADVGLTWLDPSEANDTYAFAVRRGDGKTDALQTLSNLGQAYAAGDQLPMAVDLEFATRQDGLPGLEKAYGFSLQASDYRQMEPGFTYQALKQREVDVALVYSTDGRIEAFDFRLLDDDKSYFPYYVLTPVVRTDTLTANPGLAAPLNALSAKLDNRTMQDLNAQVDVEQKALEDVARAFLSESGLL